MEKIIIENRTNYRTVTILPFIESVLKMGRISDNKKQYCYISRFEGAYGVIMVATGRNKKSDRFVVYQDVQPNNALAGDAAAPSLNLE